MPRLKLTLAYVGTAYHGWQTQARKNGSPLPTIQSTLEAVASRILGERVHIHGAGRTDAGVHAEGQIAHMDIPESRTGLDWQLALNTGLPRDIRVAAVQLMPETFHAQHDAVRKIYEYRLWLSRRYTPPQLYPFVWACGPVQTDRMDAAAACLLGTHDFSSLRNTGTDLLSSVRTMLSVTRQPSGDMREGCMELRWRFEADGFLKQMVRNSMGLLVAVGQGKIDVEEVPVILQAKDRRKAPVTAPPQGLTLKEVWY